MSERHQTYTGRMVNHGSFAVLSGGLRFPEGPAFDRDGSLWAVELKGASLVRYNEETVTRFDVGGGPNGITIGKDGILWFCDSLQNAVRTFNPDSRATATVISSVGPDVLNNPNDLVFDTSGNLIFTCPGNSRTVPTGYVCVFTTDGCVKKISINKYFPNGVAFKADTSELVFAETYKHRLWIGDWNPETCELHNERVWCDTGGPDGPGGPDGMALDAEGNLFVAVYGTGKVKMIDKMGSIFGEITLNGKNPTNCAFDPSGKLGLVVTEAEEGVLISIQLQ